MDSYAYSARSDLGFSLFLDRRCKIVYFIGKKKKAALTLLALLALLARALPLLGQALQNHLLYRQKKGQRKKSCLNFTYLLYLLLWYKSTSTDAAAKNRLLFIGNAEGTHNLLFFSKKKNILFFYRQC